MNETVLVCGCQVQVDRSGVGHCWVDVSADEDTAMTKRLTAEQEQQAIADFCDYRYPDGAPDGFADGCRVCYRDAEDGSRYEVVDAQGHGDGSGEWTEVA